VIHAVVFDLDNTVYDYDLCNREAMKCLSEHACGKYSLSRAVFEEIFRAAKNKVKVRLGNTSASHNRILYMQAFLELLGEPPAKDAVGLYNVYWDRMLETMEPFPYVIPLMETLKRNDIGIAVLTDLTAHIQHRKIGRLGIAEYVDVLVTSEEAGQEKPSGRAFKLLVEKTDLPPGELLMVGDSREKDCRGAADSGMHSLLFEKSMSETMGSICLEYIRESGRIV